MNKIISTFLGLLAAGSAFAAGPFLTIGDDLKVSLTLDASARYDDNVYLAANGEKDDFVFMITPGIIAHYGTDVSRTNVAFSLAESFNRYADVDNLDADLMALNFNANHRTEIYKVGLNVAFNQYNVSSPVYLPTEVSGVNIERNVVRAGVNGEYSVSKKTKIGLGFTYQDVHYKDDMGIDSTDYVVPVNVYYAISPKMDISAGVQYRRSVSEDVFNAPTATFFQYKFDDLFYNVGVRGEITPKLNGGVNVGVTTRDVKEGRPGDNNDGETLFGISANLTYAFSAKTLLTLNVRNDFGSRSWDGGTQKTFSARLGLQTDLSIQWRINAQVGYQNSDFMDHSVNGGPRKDDYVDVSLNVIYLFNESMSAAGGYMLRTNSSNSDNAEFTSNIVSVSFSFKY